MTTIAVIQSTNSIQGDLVFRGVYGTAIRLPVPVPADGEEAQTPTIQFKLAPEFNAISSVFTYIDAQMCNVTENEVRLINLSEQQVEQVKDQLMLDMKNRWARLYETHTNTSTALLSAALKGEAANVTAAVDRHFAARGVQVWSVPVVATVRAQIDGAYYADKDELLSGLMSSHPLIALEIDHTGQTVLQATGPAPEGAQIDSAQQDQAAAAMDSVTPAWNDYAGIQAQVKGTVQIAATTAMAAVAHLTYLISETRGNNAVFAPQLQPTEICSVSQMTYGDAVTDADDTPRVDDADLDDDARHDADRG